jgi:hypothetical protein
MDMEQLVEWELAGETEIMCSNLYLILKTKTS